MRVREREEGGEGVRKRAQTTTDKQTRVLAVGCALRFAFSSRCLLLGCVGWLWRDKRESCQSHRKRIIGKRERESEKKRPDG